MGEAPEAMPDRIWAWIVPSSFRAWAWWEPARKGGSTVYIRADVAERWKRERDALVAAAQDAECVLIEYEVGSAAVLDELQAAIRDATE